MSDDTTPERADDGTAEVAEPAPPSKHRRAVWTTIVVTQLVLALVTAGAVFLVHRNLNDNIAEGKPIAHKLEKKDKGPDTPLNILVLGSDTRAGRGNGIDGLTEDGQRSDTVILLHVSQDRSNAYGVSLPRDALVDRPDCMVDGKNVPGEEDAMFNTAFSVGGAQCTVQTVEELTGIYIDHFLVLDFNGFKDMVDAVDGVEVCLPKAVSDDEHNIYFDAGTQTLLGQDALSYVRERSQLSVTGDIGRMKRQQAFIASMVSKVMSAGTLSQPRKVIDFLNAVTSSIEVDEDLDTVGKLYNLSKEFRDTGLDKIKFLTVPNEPYEPNPNRLVWTKEADDLWERIRQDQQLGKDFSADSIGADDSVGTEDTGDDGDGGSDGSGDVETQERIDAGLCA